MLLKEDFGKLNQGQKETVEHINESNQRMIKLVNDLLEVSKAEEGKSNIKTKPTDLIPLVEHVMEESAIISDAKNINMGFSIPNKTFPKVLVDPQLLTQVIQNLVSNARRIKSGWKADAFSKASVPFLKRKKARKRSR